MRSVGRVHYSANCRRRQMASNTAGNHPVTQRQSHSSTTTICRLALRRRTEHAHRWYRRHAARLRPCRGRRPHPRSGDHASSIDFVRTCRADAPPTGNTASWPLGRGAATARSRRHRARFAEYRSLHSPVRGSCTTRCGRSRRDSPRTQRWPPTARSRRLGSGE